jgi:hypothetical protein
MVIAIPDEKFYTSRFPGAMHPLEEAKLWTNGLEQIKNYGMPMNLPCWKFMII